MAAQQSYLFEINDKRVYPYPTTLLISPFKEIWDRDTSPNKEVALQEFAYIEFTISFLKSNPYKGYSEELKPTKVKEDIIVEPNWEPDELIEAGQQKIVEFQKEASPTYRYYLSNKIAAEKTENFFMSFDYTEVNLKSGNPLYKPKEITGAIKDAGDVMKRLSELKKKVEEELFEAIKNRSDKRISPFADPNSL